MADINWDSIVQEALGAFTTDLLPPTLELPALPMAAMKFSQMAGDDGASLEELGRIIETDSGLTTSVLKYANSSFLGLRNKVKTVPHALSMLGRRQSRVHVLTTATQGAIRAKRSRLVNQTTFWNSSLQKALFAKEVARLLKVDEDVAFAGAMLQDYILPVVSNELYDKYLGYLSNAQEHPEALSDFEQSEFGWNHALAGAGLASRWNFPAELICCILYHNYGLRILGHPELGRTAVAAVAVSALLPDELRQQRGGIQQLVQLSGKWKTFDLESLAGKVDEQHAEAGLASRNAFPLTRLVKRALTETAA